MLNSRPNKLKVFAKLKDFWLNSIRFLNKLKIFIKDKDFFAKLMEFSAKLKGFVAKLKIWAKKFTPVGSQTLKKQACLIALSFIHNSREDGARKAALILMNHSTSFDPN